MRLKFLLILLHCQCTNLKMSFFRFQLIHAQNTYHNNSEFFFNKKVYSILANTQQRSVLGLKLKQTGMLSSGVQLMTSQKSKVLNLSYNASKVQERGLE